MIRAAIHGFGRIGRSVLRALYELNYRKLISVVAVNDIADPDQLTHLFRYDSAHGRLPFDVMRTNDGIVVGGDHIAFFAEPEIGRLPWANLGVDIVLECTGAMHERAGILRHLDAGAGRVLLSCPGPADVDFTAVYGVNHHLISPEHRIVSNASCTSNCLIPVIDTLDRSFGIVRGNVTVIHSLLNDQSLMDSSNRAGDRRKMRTCRSIVPVETKLDLGIARVLPRLAGRFITSAVRVPVINVSAMEITVETQQRTNVAAIHACLSDASSRELRGVLGLSDEPRISVDYNHDPRSCVVDMEQTQVTGENLVKLFAWFDNEWAFAVRMLDMTTSWFDCHRKNNDAPTTHSSDLKSTADTAPISTLSIL